MQRIDTYTLNKVAGWILFTALLVFGLNELSNIVYHAETPEQPGMIVEVAEVTADADDAETGEATPSIANLLAEASPEDGQAASRACQACHTFEQGEPHRVGPNLWDIVGQPIAHHDDYSYSDALQQMSDETWTFEALNQFIADPRGFAPGTKMTYGGMGRDEQRADLLAYLRSLSDDPQPLPEPTPAATEEEPQQETQDEPDEPVETQEAADEAAPTEVVAAGDPDQGEAAARQCQACHTFDQGEPHRVGPNLWGVVGAQIARHDDYAYSDALQQMSDQTWTPEALDQFIANPGDYASGTKMTYGGMRRDEQRADLLAYLGTLSDEPQPTAQPADEAAAADDEQPTAEPDAADDQETQAEPTQQEAIGQMERASESQPDQAQQEAQDQTTQAELSEPQQAEGEAAQPAPEPVADGNPERGQSAARQCQACHTFDQGESHRVGPNLWGIVGAQVARHDDYAYSDALGEMSDQTWTPEALDQFIANPREFAPGTKMTYGGMRRDEQRADLIAYLRTLGGDQ